MIPPIWSGTSEASGCTTRSDNCKGGAADVECTLFRDAGLPLMELGWAERLNRCAPQQFSGVSYFGGSSPVSRRTGYAAGEDSSKINRLAAAGAAVLALIPAEMTV